jgi:cytochrome c peroxidase
VRFHKGVFGNSLKRNTLAVSGNSPNLFWDGRSGSIMDLVLKPVANHEEMVQDPNVLLVKLKQNEYYPELFRKAYGNMDINLRAIENALAAFCFALAPNNSKFDVALLNALNTSNGLFNASENNGLKLFFGKARCGTCHHPEQQGGSYGSPIQTAAFANIGLDMVYADNGLGALDQQKTNNGKFKIPNLKNVALTAPYMHDGRFNTLEEVIEHYNSRVLPNLNLSPKLFNKALTTEEIEMLDFQGFNPFTGPVLPVSLNLSNDEKADLLAFLKTLTDEDLVNDIKFSDPFPR